MKGSGWFLKPPPYSFVPFTFTFPFLSQLFVCLCVSVSRVCAPTLPLTNNTQLFHIPVYIHTLMSPAT